MEQVDTYPFEVPVAETPTEYDGGFGFDSTPGFVLGRPEYAVGESIQAVVNVWCWRSARWLPIEWQSYVRAYDHLGNLLTSFGTTHFAIPNVADYETYNENIGLGLQPPAGLQGYLELWCEGSPAVKVATAEFFVPLVGNGPPPMPPGKTFPWLPLGAGILAIGVIALIAKRSR